MGPVPADNSDSGQASVIDEILLVALTVLLCAILAALCMGFFSPSGENPFIPPPEILKIISVDHNNENGERTFASSVTLQNIGTKALQNSDYRAEIYINDKKQRVIIDTLQAHEFIDTHHYGIGTLSGSGPTGYTWGPGDHGVFNLKDKMIHPGDLLRIDIIYKEDDSVYSRSEMLVP